jgi:hypothetical protein
MLVRMRSIKKLSPHDYRVSLDVVDQEQSPWDYGDCVVQIDLHDGISKHLSSPRGLLKPAFELYSLAPDEPPTATEARLLWEMGKAVHRYVGRLFEAGILCPFGEQAKDDAPERSE